MDGLNSQNRQMNDYFLYWLPEKYITGNAGERGIIPSAKTKNCDRKWLYHGPSKINVENIVKINFYKDLLI